MLGPLRPQEAAAGPGQGPGGRQEVGGGVHLLALIYTFLSTIYLIIYTSTACVSIYTYLQVCGGRGQGEQWGEEEAHPDPRHPGKQAAEAGQHQVQYTTLVPGSCISTFL